MGQEIDSQDFSALDFQRFRERLQQETHDLKINFDRHLFAETNPVAGFELEAWLVDRQAQPLAKNKQLLATLDPQLFTTELAQFNIEINNPPHALTGGFLRQFHTELQTSWQLCQQAASDIDARMAMIGILPTAQQHHFQSHVMSPLKRFKAINQEIFRQRGGESIRIDIRGKEHLRTTHNDVMLEAATTALQLHLQVPCSKAAAYYNASLLISAPLLAACGNSPYLFAHALWEETRIPLFEQSIATASSTAKNHHQRVSFGSGYVEQSLYETFLENFSRYPVLLPMHMDTPVGQFSHLRLHNGTVWRWNRPLIGGQNDALHLRIEHRSLPGGPTVVDMVANAALYYGLVQYVSETLGAGEPPLAFDLARDNFYAAAQYGLSAELTWTDRHSYQAKDLLADALLSAARQGLDSLSMDAADSEFYLGVIAARVRSGQTGAVWQQRFIARHGKDMQAMTLAYLDHQDAGLPVHEWSV